MERSLKMFQAMMINKLKVKMIKKKFKIQKFLMKINLKNKLKKRHKLKNKKKVLRLKRSRTNHISWKTFTS
jgi:hypothetical protein